MRSNPAQPRPGRARHLPQLRATLTILTILTILPTLWLAPAHPSAQQVSVRGSSNTPPSPIANPLDGYVRDALRANLSLAQDQLEEDRAVAAVREARALRLPSLAFSSRRTEVDGGLDLGNLVTPAYRALNQITGTSSFPTNIGLTLPFPQETRVRLAQPIFQPAIGAGIRAT